MQVNNSVDEEETIINNQLEAFNVEQIRSRQLSLKIKYSHCLNKSNVKFFQKLKYKCTVYQLGQCIHLYDRTEKNPFVGKIVHIIKLPDEEQKLPFIEVQWLIRKSHLPENIYTQYFPYFSQAEVFPSNQNQFVYVESIMGLCYVISDKQYQQLDSTAENIYFSRANFDRKSNKLFPEPNQWPRSCICDKPVNPDMEYLQCQKCQKWFHFDCLKLNKNKVMEYSFYCKKCNQKK